jgi:hypothetical protein
VVSRAMKQAAAHAGGKRRRSGVRDFLRGHWWVAVPIVAIALLA